MRKLTSDEFKQYELGTLAKLDEICCENNIKYFVAYGTLIGAIRHKGFIPWDDDADVWMPRKDYDKFIEFCINNENLISPYKLAHYKNNSNYFTKSATQILRSSIMISSIPQRISDAHH